MIISIVFVTAIYQRILNLCNQNFYDEDYYERGITTKKSGYENYSWMAERAFPMALFLRGRFGQSTILDYGCAKGFLVHAMRMLGMRAYGYDISKYAVEHCHPAVKKYLIPTLDREFDSVVAKDVLEHVSSSEIEDVLKNIRGVCNKALFVIPLGDRGKYRIPAYHLDQSHVIAEDEEWWLTKFSTAGFSLVDFKYQIPGIKDNWTSKYPFGNLIVELS